ncbi:DsbA family oxidoreductase [Sphaerisporangium fuscum]|uniref:DsbA family oxidoreductase n=1 Tax=Sphaerisporangium fuscum TaxID=2835868 RepID=UPI001BDCA4F4|nr:DsbA family oxidoreductase [Sphaerisporangium fuscum]
MRVEIWSDVVCPWCYIGKRRLEKALAGFEHAGEVEVVWRSYQLDPSHPKGVREPVHEALAKKMGGTAAQVRTMTERVKALGAQEDLAYDFDRAVMVNTFDAHRLTHLAKAHGLGDQAHERLLRAHLVEGEAVDDAETLVRLGAEIGVPAEETRRMLGGDDHVRDVEEDIREAQALGVSGVPFFVLDRAYGVSGAQPVETFLAALRQAHGRATATR